MREIIISIVNNCNERNGTSCNLPASGVAISFIKGADLEGAPGAEGGDRWRPQATPPDV